MVYKKHLFYKFLLCFSGVQFWKGQGVVPLQPCFPDLCVLRFREMVTVDINALRRTCGCSTDATLLICSGSESRAESYIKQTVSFGERKKLL